MPSIRSASIVFMLTLVSAAKKVVEEAPAAPNPVVDYVLSIVMPVVNASLGCGKDAARLAMDAPAFGVSVFVWFTGKLRDFPDLVKNVYNGDANTLDSLTGFCADAAGIIFTVYMSLAALNLLLALMVGVKDYFVSYMNLPTSLPVIGKLPAPLLDVRNVIQKEVLDRIKDF